MSVFPYDVTPDDPGYLISFPDVPEALTGADSEEDIEREARDCLATALAGYALEGRVRPASVSSPCPPLSRQSSCLSRPLRHRR